MVKRIELFRTIPAEARLSIEISVNAIFDYWHDALAWATRYGLKVEDVVDYMEMYSQMHQAQQVTIFVHNDEVTDGVPCVDCRVDDLWLPNKIRTVGIMLRGSHALVNLPAMNAVQLKHAREIIQDALIALGDVTTDPQTLIANHTAVLTEYQGAQAEVTC